ncbi:phosphatidate cytidylyltransferase [Alicyclobacillus sp. SO9]|uniref:phosphatidate cytidylyltransferase n=1 Tax=Alicyclobacillus sp. SO9 TaxID=2665646 RepID=UPI0018E8E402|nr:phosphatidate cytidylyltransferase [Alicyclobacillus sp. SO9]QQE80831.1 phosphatidate cytidylyltransferase [Alicyclobacillus sp. SO9]
MLRTRVVTAVLGVVIVLALLLWGNIPWKITVWLVTLAGAAEFAGIVGFKRWSVMSLWSYFVVSLIEWWPAWHMLIVVQVIVGVALVLPVLMKNRVTVSQSATVLIGSLYIGYGGESLTSIRALSHGWAWLLLLLIVIWMSDTTAYLVGGRLQGPKLWPAISPGKTVSGAIGGIVGSVAGAVIFGWLAIRGFDLFAYATMGALISVAGQVGDLVESAYKRSGNVKDSGHLLPGHGGILDRIDSLLFAAPLALYLITSGAPTWFQ